MNQRIIGRFMLYMLATALPLSGAVRPAAPSTSQGIVSFANGSGKFRSDGNLVNFSFSAIQDGDGTTHGQVEAFATGTGLRIQVDVTCLNVVGNIATIGGKVKNSTFLREGQPLVFTVQDNGEGNNAVDLMTVFEPRAEEIDCGVMAARDLVPIEAGNIQVRQER